MIDLAAFALSLRASAPTPEALIGEGLLPDEAADFIASYDLPARPEPVPVDIDGTFRTFFADFDPSKLEIGMVRFPDPPYRVGQNWVVGVVEADPLVFDPETGALRVEDHARAGQVLWRCADSPGHLLSALLEASRHLGRQLGDSSGSDPSAALEACISAAGGAAYENFFRMLLGIVD